jgi:hypothetical protein
VKSGSRHRRSKQCRVAMTALFVSFVVLAGAGLRVPRAEAVPPSESCGKVRDAWTAKPIGDISVTQLIKSTSGAALPKCASESRSDTSGSYCVICPPPAIIRFAGVGYETLEVPLSDLVDPVHCCLKDVLMTPCNWWPHWW